MAEELRLKKISRLISTQEKILDLGCSQIPNKYLNNKTVIGVDLEDKPLPENYTELVIHDVLKLSEKFKDETIDGIVAGEIIEHLEDPIGFLKECYDTLTDEGLLVLSTPNPNSPVERLLTLNLCRKYFYTKEHIMLYPQRWLIRIMEIAGFEDVKLHSGGMIFPFLSLIPFPRPWCYQTIATGIKRNK